MARVSNIRVARVKLGYTQARLAQKLGVSASAVAMWERGKSAPRASMLPDLARELHCSIDELLRPA